MADPTRLLKAIGSSKTTRAAVITTYNASFPFFEHVVLRRLQGVGCSHIVLLVDDARFRQAVASESLRPRLAGIEYSVFPVRYPGAFHPKILLQVGERHGRLWLGSHNLTLAGFNHNIELTTYAGGRGDDDGRGLVQQAWRAVRQWGDDTSGATEALMQVEQLAPWLAEPAPSAAADVVLSSTHERALWPQLRGRLPPDLTRILVAGPYFDQRLAFLHTLCAEAPGAEVVVGLRPGDGAFPAHRRGELPARVRFVDATALVPDKRGASTLHAKALLFEGRTRSLLVAGSANPSAPAYLAPARRNAEAVVARVLPAGSDPLGLRVLATAPPLDDDAWAQVDAPSDDEAPPSGPPVWTAPLDGRTLVPPSDLPAHDRVVFLGEAHTALATTPAGAAIAPPDPHLWPRVRWIRLEQGDQIVGRILVHHRRKLARLARTREDLKLSDALRSLETRVPDLASVLSLLDPLLDQPATPRSGATRQAPTRGTAGIGSGGAEAACLPTDPDELYGTEGDLAEVMLYVHHRLGAQVDAAERSEEEVVGTDDEALVVASRWAPSLEVREHVQHRFHRVRQKLGRVLQKPSYERASLAHDRIAKLSAILGLANATIRRSPPEPWQSLDHLRLVGIEDLGQLLYDGVGAAYFQHDLAKATTLLGPQAEEVRSVPSLLAWLCRELDMWPPQPSPRTGPPPSDDDLTDRAVWATLFPSLDKAHWERLVDIVRSSDASDAGEAWLRAAYRWTRHIRRIKKAPGEHVAHRRKPRPGDLVILGSGPRAVLRVVREEIGGPKQKRRVAWPLPAAPYGSRSFDHAAPLHAEVWVRRSAGRQ